VRRQKKKAKLDSHNEICRCRKGIDSTCTVKKRNDKMICREKARKATCVYNKGEIATMGKDLEI